MQKDAPQWEFVPIVRLCIIRIERTENEREHEASTPALELCEQSLKTNTNARRYQSHHRCFSL